jgi:hypothetical protein
MDFEEFHLFVPNQRVSFMMTDASGREVKMVGRVISHDMKSFTYEVWLPNGMTISVVDSALRPYMGPVPLMNNTGSVNAYSSTTAPGSPVTMPRTASSSSFTFNLNNWNKGNGAEEAVEEASNNNYNENIYEGDPWERLAAFVEKENKGGIKINKRNTRIKRSVQSAANKAQRKKGGRMRRTKRSAQRTKRSAQRTKRRTKGRR